MKGRSAEMLQESKEVEGGMDSDAQEVSQSGVCW